MANYLIPAKGRPTSSGGAGAAEHPGLANSEFYRIQLYKRGDKPLRIEGNLASDFALNVSSSWDTPLSFMDDIAGNALGALGGNLGKAAGKVAGASGYTKNIMSTGKSWAGGSELTFDLPIRIDAIADTGSELMEPLRNLLKTVLPTVTGAGVLLPPGPSVLSIPSIGDDLISLNITPEDWAKAMMSAFEENAFHLRIGSFFHMFPCVLETVHAQFSAINEHETGHPMFIDFQLQIKSYLTATTQDMDNWIINNSKR